MDGNRILGFDPEQKRIKSCSVTLPPDAMGLAISNNINLHNNQFTFYTTVNEVLHYYDGKKWVSTGHNSGSVNLAGGMNFIYILDGINGKMYKYDGTGDAEYMMSFPAFEGPYDVVCDMADNFYLIHTNPGKLIQYDTQGTIIKEYSVLGVTGEQSGGGFAYVGKMVYGNFSQGSKMGIFESGRIIFSPTQLIPQVALDFASCPLEIFEPEKEDSVEDNIIFANDNVPTSVLGRSVELQSTIQVTQPEFDIEIYDKSIVDGDSVSLSFNGKWLIQNYGVVVTKKLIHVRLDTRSKNNYLVLYAHNLGDIPPNTAAVSVILGGKEYNITLSSDLNKCGALNFEYSP